MKFLKDEQNLMLLKQVWILIFGLGTGYLAVITNCAVPPLPQNHLYTFHTLDIYVYTGPKSYKVYAQVSELLASQGQKPQKGHCASPAIMNLLEIKLNKLMCSIETQAVKWVCNTYKSKISHHKNAIACSSLTTHTVAKQVRVP